MVLFSVVLRRWRFPPVHAGGGSGDAEFPLYLWGQHRRSWSRSVFWCWGLCVQPLGTEWGCKQCSLPAGESFTNLEGDIFFFPAHSTAKQKVKSWEELEGVSRVGGSSPSNQFHLFLCTQTCSNFWPSVFLLYSASESPPKGFLNYFPSLLLAERAAD